MICRAEGKQPPTRPQQTRGRRGSTTHLVQSHTLRWSPPSRPKSSCSLTSLEEHRHSLHTASFHPEHDRVRSICFHIPTRPFCTPQTVSSNAFLLQKTRWLRWQWYAYRWIYLHMSTDMSVQMIMHMHMHVSIHISHNQIRHIPSAVPATLHLLSGSSCAPVLGNVQKHIYEHMNRHVQRCVCV